MSWGLFEVLVVLVGHQVPPTPLLPSRVSQPTLVSVLSQKMFLGVFHVKHVCVPYTWKMP